MSVETMRTVAPRPGTRTRRVRVERSAPVALEPRTETAVEEVRLRPGHAPALHSSAVSGDRIGVIVAAPRPGTDRASGARRVLRAILNRVNSRAVRTHFGTVAGITILGVLLWRLGTGVFLDGLRRIDAPTLLIGLAIGVVTTVFSAWRWALVARGLRIKLPLGPAVADYYRALFLNAALPGGILGDVHRAVRHGQSAGDMGRAVRAVVLERVAGQIALAVVGVAILLGLDSPVMSEVRGIAPLVLLAALGALAVVAAVRMNRPAAATRRGRALRTTLDEARAGLFSRANWPGVTVSSLIILATTSRCSWSPPAPPGPPPPWPSCCRSRSSRWSPWACR